MIKLTLPVMALVMAGFLSGCTDPGPPVFDSTPLNVRVKSVAGGSSYSDLGIWVDPKYGCQYLTGEVKIGIFMTPRIAEDRMPLCDHGASLNGVDERAQYEALKKKFEGQ